MSVEEQNEAFDVRLHTFKDGERTGLPLVSGLSLDLSISAEDTKKRVSSRMPAGQETADGGTAAAEDGSVAEKQDDPPHRTYTAYTDGLHLWEREP